MKDFPTEMLLGALNRAAASCIDIDPDSKRKLANLQGKVFCLEITSPPLTLYVIPNAQGIEFCRSVETEPHVTLSATALAFAKLAQSQLRGGGRANGNGVMAGEVVIRGDVELGQALQKILAELDLDWEELLANYIGDTVAHKLGNAVRGLAGWAEDSYALTCENVADYVTEEKSIFISKPSMEKFDAAVNRVRADVDRVALRVENLKLTLQHSNRH